MKRSLFSTEEEACWNVANSKKRNYSTGDMTTILSSNDNTSLNISTIESDTNVQHNAFEDNFESIFEEAHLSYLSNGNNLLINLEKSKNELVSLGSEVESFTQELLDNVHTEGTDLAAFHTKMQKCLSVFNNGGYNDAVVSTLTDTQETLTGKDEETQGNEHEGTEISPTGQCVTLKMKKKNGETLSHITMKEQKKIKKFIDDIM